MELDHVFIATRGGAPAAESLVRFGLIEGSRNMHPGQGTANRRFFFGNAMLELLWIESRQEASAGEAERLALVQRADEDLPLTSPFGVCFRPTPERGGPIFQSWSYRPGYLPAPLSVEVSLDAPATEPLWFFIGFSDRPDRRPQEDREPLDHPCGFREISSLRVTLPANNPLSQSARKIADAGLVTLLPGTEHLLEIGFDGRLVGKSFHFGPELPLVFHW
jgi:hypothetical protein